MKRFNRGASGVAITVVIGGICTWCAGLSYAIFNDHAEIASMNTSITYIQKAIDEKVIPALNDRGSYARLSRYASSTPE